MVGEPAGALITILPHKTTPADSSAGVYDNLIVSPSRLHEAHSISSCPYPFIRVGAVNAFLLFNTVSADISVCSELYTVPELLDFLKHTV